MTTKKFIVSERVNNEWQNVAEFKIRALAVGHIVEKMSDNKDADPQNFKIEEVEAVNEEAVVMETANKVAKSLGIFGDEFEIKPFFYDGQGFAEVHFANQKYPSVSRHQLERLFKVMDEVNAELPEGYEVFSNINHECAIRIMLSTPKKEENK